MLILLCGAVTVDTADEASLCCCHLWYIQIISMKKKEKVRRFGHFLSPSRSHLCDAHAARLSHCDWHRA